MKKLILQLAAILCFPVILNAEYVLEEALVQNDKSEALEANDAYVIYRMVRDEGDEFCWPYLLKIDRSIFEKKSSIIMYEMLNTGFPSDSMRFVQERALSSMRWGWKYDEPFKDCFIYMMPMIPRPASITNFYTHALDRDCFLDQPDNYERIDLQAVAMIEDARDFLFKKFGIETEEKVGIRGFSACGVFAQRFSAIHPERVKFCIAGGFGGVPLLPMEKFEGKKLTYPVGIGDFKELMGKDFDYDAYAAVPRFLHMGGQESNDSVDFPDAYDDRERNLINELLGENPPERWSKTSEILKGFKTKNECYTDTNEAHGYSDEMSGKIKAFISRQIE